MNKPYFLSLNDFSVNVLDSKRNNNQFTKKKYNLKPYQYSYKQPDSKKKFIPDTMQFVKPNSMLQMSFSNMNVGLCQQDNIHGNNFNRNGNNFNINSNNNGINNNKEIINNKEINKEKTKKQPLYLDLLKSIKSSSSFHKLHNNIESFQQQELSQKFISICLFLIIIYYIYIKMSKLC